MLETPTAIANAEEIAAVPGVDVLLIGTNDLCAEIGIHGDFGNDRVADAYRTMIAGARKHGKYPGMAGSTMRRSQWRGNEGQLSITQLRRSHVDYE